MIRFLRFAGLSGMGWLLDVGLLLALVSMAHLAASTANVISSCTAATVVFLVSRHKVHTKASGFLAMRVALYIGYSLCLILLASVCVQWLVGALSTWSPVANSAKPQLAAAALAKVIVTPPQLLLNFLVSRFLSERQLSRAA